MTEVHEVQPVAGPVQARLRPPGSKSITNRALVAAALSEGTSTLRGALAADDTAAMLQCLGNLGAEVELDAEGTMSVTGFGPQPRPGPVQLEARLSGTTARFAIALTALGEGPYTLDGAEPLRARPMADGIEALREMGATVQELGEAGHLPVRVTPGPAMASAVSVRGDASSQFLSGLMLAGAATPQGITVELISPLVSEPYVAMTAAVMSRFGATVERNETSFVVRGPYRPTDTTIEPDASAASYLFAAAAICGGEITVEGLSRSSLQGDLGFVEVLERMGAEVTWGHDEVTVAGTGRLAGLAELDLSEMSDTAQTAAVVAAFADSATTITGIGFIRHKETDRVGNTVRELRRASIDAVEMPDGLRVNPGPPRPARIQTYEDHRMAMAFALLGLAAPGIQIADPGCVAKTYPDYWEALDSIRASAGR